MFWISPLYLFTQRFYLWRTQLTTSTFWWILFSCGHLFIFLQYELAFESNKIWNFNFHTTILIYLEATGDRVKNWARGWRWKLDRFRQAKKATSNFTQSIIAQAVSKLFFVGVKRLKKLKLQTCFFFLIPRFPEYKPPLWRKNFLFS